MSSRSKLFLAFTYLAVVLFLAFSPVSAVFANMGPPYSFIPYDPIEYGAGGVTLKKNDEIKVVKENLDIVYDNTGVAVTAKYWMLNLTDKSVSTESLFLRPFSQSEINVEENIEIDSAPVDYTCRAYVSDEELLWFVSVSDKCIYTMRFDICFEPNAQREVTVYYKIAPAENSIDFTYFFSPANYWAGFEDLTVTVWNRYEDKYGYGYGIINIYNFNFKQHGWGWLYEYHSDVLPEEDLHIFFGFGYAQHNSYGSHYKGGCRR